MSLLGTGRQKRAQNGLGEVAQHPTLGTASLRTRSGSWSQEPLPSREVVLLQALPAHLCFSGGPGTDRTPLLATPGEDDVRVPCVGQGYQEETGAPRQFPPVLTRADDCSEAAVGGMPSAVLC